MAILCYVDYHFITQKVGQMVRFLVGNIYDNDCNSIYMRVDTIIACDPGMTGSIAIRFHNQRKVYKMPVDIVDVDVLLKHYKSVSDSILIVIEQIRLHNTGNMAMVSRMQKMFANYNQLKTAARQGVVF